MSGDSGRALKQVYGQSVRPEPVSQKSLTENVADIINEVVFPNPSHYEGREKIVWVKFDQCDINDLSQYKEKIECNGNVPPFLLFIGYTNGVQVWVVQATGLAVEVLSLRQGPVRTIKILVSPQISNKSLDKYSLKRPIAAICDSASPGTQFHSVAFLSLLTGETQPLKTIKFKSPVQDIESNKQVIVISFVEKLAIFEATTFDDLFTISTCYKSPGPCLNPIALGDQWLAFADRKLHNTHQSCGGVISELAISYKSSMISVAKSLSKGLKDLGESVATNLMGTKIPPPSVSSHVSPSPAMTPGVITIIDPLKVNSNELNLSKGPNQATIAHFVAHQGVPIVCMEFDCSGTLLATADKLAHNFNVFKLYCHPSSSSNSSVHHLYCLYRGDTTAKVLTMTFSLDARWLAVATHRGTTHIYPIAPYGGTVSMRTHKSLCVVNKLSRFQRSAGLDDNPSSGRNSPVLSASPGTVKIPFEISPNAAYHNPFYPPYPTATVVKAIGRVRQPDLSNILEAYGTGHSPPNSPPSNKSSKMSAHDNIIKVALCFGMTRGWIAGSPTVLRESRRRPVDSLFVMGDHGYLVEYTLTIKPHASIAQEKIRDDETLLELEIEAYAEWPLLRESANAELRTPLHRENPLLIPLNAQIIHQPALEQIPEQTNPEEKWMAQVEIQTYTGPNRRLWMGPQFSFKTISGSGNLSSVELLEAQDAVADDDPSLDFPSRSSPLTIGSKNLVYIEAQSHSNSVESDSGESDKVRARSRLRDAIADAMNDVQCDLGSCEKDAREEYSYDMSDVMDITCDPVGPSTDYPNSVPPQVAPHVEDQLQAVTTKLRQVVVSSQPQESVSPLWGSQNPSVGDCKILHSSSEEFDLQTSLDPSLSSIGVADIAPLGQWIAPDEAMLKTSWGPFVVETKPSLAPPSSSVDSFPPMSDSISKSATTSEEDLWASKESKKDRKRRRKRAVKDQDTLIIVDQPSSIHDDEEEPFNLASDPCGFDIDLEHFHTAEEFPTTEEPIMMESIHDDPDDLQRALEEASSDESHQPVRTSKDDVKAAVAGGEADEMFPFRETSSDEEDGGSLRVRRRALATVTFSGHFNEEEDDRETSGDDRKTTSESDVTTSPNPRLSASSKSKKKKKKRK